MVKSFRAYTEAKDSTFKTEFPEKHDWLYHTSPEENHSSIEKNGLTSKRAVAKNGVHFKWDINFARKRSDSQAYADKGHQYRVKYHKLKEPSHDPIAGYVRTEHDIPKSDIEHFHNGKWKKL